MIWSGTKALPQNQRRYVALKKPPDHMSQDLINKYILGRDREERGCVTWVSSGTINLCRGK